MYKFMFGATGGNALVWVRAGCPQLAGQSVGVKDAQHPSPRAAKKMRQA